ncbi:MAG: TIGR01906 family membrane protein [Eubacteriaceae bacterium]|nr:TIGR01906 family membrane protein [Eubacteriaceae bacterium]
MIKRLIIVLLILITPVLVILTNTEYTVKSDKFFNGQYNENDVMYSTRMDIDELMKLTDEIQDFLFDKREDFRIEGVVDGVKGQIFNEREIVHMDDVKVLFQKGIALRNILAVIFLAILVYGFKTRRPYVFKALLISAVVYFIFMIVTGSLLYFDFNKYFNLFHEIFFKNDYWILDPDESVLINLVPLNFFISITLRIVGFSSLCMAIIGSGSFMIAKKMEGKYGRK